ncbi:MAG: N-acetylglucosamine-6-phosphate deacetylase, partial [Actinomycetes bacterium]
MPTEVAAPRVVAGGVVHAPGAVVLGAGRVVAVRTGAEALADADVVLDSGVLVPGLVDAQVNGYAGVDLVDASPQEWAHVSQRLVRAGVTAYVPTFISASVDVLEAALVRAAAARASWQEDGSDAGAEPIGVHLEGPFL